ncbi:MAG: hypothetical protein RIR50_221 [Pseudomonadota bacterium]|jgi:uncharacterized protein YigA (DUF484 family)|uniref:DUF484 domain-containing protein n=1 Tax=Polynucleobacter cosmopolitanus TaxID=351345 RepID=A0A229FVD4_9BURK|nr:DUF484 family protein [Polynucleobacter cosmopolitanus]OXL15873.1 hypothetical protein AOC33_01890 [Polynucleobacter cosmopolitanus]
MTQANNQTAEQQEREALVAEWLLATPGFFERHADLLADIQLKNPHGDRAISLQERQLGVLRQQNQALNQRLSDMLRFGSQNDKTQGLMIQWLSNLLSAKSEADVRAAISAGLATIFDIEQVELLDGDHGNFCGSANQSSDAIKALLKENIQSLAVINLSSLNVQILLASQSAEKFTSDMGRVYLDQIGELALAALTRSKE